MRRILIHQNKYGNHEYVFIKTIYPKIQPTDCVMENDILISGGKYSKIMRQKFNL